MIIAVVIMSGREEPFLSACLESVAGSVDLVAINDNASGDANPNMGAVRDSLLFKEGKIRVSKTPFEGFGKARNACLELIEDLRPDHPWILMLDCDEVHTEGLASITRKILPRLPESIGGVDVYTRQFIRTFDYYSAVERRHNFLFRLYPETRWEGSVHEKLLGVRGEKICLPYGFYHYGNALAPESVLDKWKLYARCGDPFFGMERLEGMDASTFMDDESMKVLDFKGRHPLPVGETLLYLREARRKDFVCFDAQVAQARKSFFVRLKNSLRVFHFWYRIEGRRLQMSARFFGDRELMDAIRRLSWR
jgi:hypothetical protein